MKSVRPSCKGKVRFLCSSPKLLSQLTGAPRRDDASSWGLQNPKSSKVSENTNSEQDICIPSIYVKAVTLDLNLSIHKNIFSTHCAGRTPRGRLARMPCLCESLPSPGRPGLAGRIGTWTPAPLPGGGGGWTSRAQRRGGASGPPLWPIQFVYDHVFSFLGDLGTREFGKNKQKKFQQYHLFLHHHNISNRSGS